MAYDKRSLQAGVEKCKVNIKTFEKAIEDERTTIKEYRVLIAEIEEQEKVKGN